VTRPAIVFVLCGLVAGCGSSETKEDPQGQVISRPAEDPPRNATGDPPLGRPKAKVEPSSATHVTDLKRSDSVLKDGTPH
jgi:hypothetical protein